MLETESLVWIIGNDSAVIFFFSISDLFYKIPIIFFLLFEGYMSMTHLNWEISQLFNSRIMWP